MNWNSFGLIMLIVVAWFALNRWILPACGVNTCMSGSCVVLPHEPITSYEKEEDKIMNGLLEFSDANFDSEVLKSSQPVLVDFSAAWCGPCKMLAPVVEELANENAGVTKVGKIDIDANPGIAAKYGVSSIPTIMIFKDGQVTETLVGLQPKSNIQEAMARAGQ